MRRSLMPKTLGQTVEVWADTKGYGTCRGPNCRARLTWYETTSGKKMPFTGEPVPLQTRQDPGSWRQVAVLDLADSHWSSCPDWMAFKSRRD